MIETAPYDPNLKHQLRKSKISMHLLFIKNVYQNFIYSYTGFRLLNWTFIILILVGAQISVVVHALLFSKILAEVVDSNPIGPGSLRYGHFLDSQGISLFPNLPHDIRMQKKTMVNWQR